VALVAGLDDVEEDPEEDIEDMSLEPVSLPPQAARSRDRPAAAPKAPIRVALRVGELMVGRVVVRMSGIAPW